ncbi:glutathione S-transferase family protein [Roseiarcaceae bacterium H3SJ34-1]|uniref:glutathione S-transferase family protein n=1 Tax=Terripilifer ovatus TaxID=3032367 RepID=UPI003AB92D7C|nr:glutathione S-transferase family protein [Roseiarcaceae bacterium H3SJ34-1]
MLKVWGRTNSLNVQKALLAIEEIGIPYERTDAGLHFGVNNSPEYRAMNPNGLVPTIDDDGFILWESNAIVRYLCAKYSAGKMWPVDPQVRAAADRWMDWQQTVLLDPINDIFRPLIRKMGDATPEQIEAFCKRCDANMAILDAVLSAQPWMTGQVFGMADCVVVTPVHRWFNLPIARKSFPHLERWYGAIAARPSGQKILTVPIT